MTTYNYDVLKQLAKDRGHRVEDMCALSVQHDPFYVGMPMQLLQARWFADMWHRFGYSSGVHLRRIHYQIVSQDPPIIKPDGKVYENSEGCWKYLGEASQFARYLGLVDPDAFVDRRNPGAIIHADWNYYARPEPSYGVEGGWDSSGYNLPGLPVLPGLPEALPELPTLQAHGYSDIEQDYHLEVWAEKSTVNDVLDPICQEYGANLVTGLGELSITAVNLLIRRVEHARRPARILYISDFDPKGQDMPISVARKIEYYQRKTGVDIALQPIVLTPEQVDKYNLPRVPTKNSDSAASKFERVHGPGQVELDALQALYPGELARIVTDAILNYYDPGLLERAEEQKDNLQEELDSQEEQVVANYQGEIDALESEYQGVYASFEKTRADFAELIAGFEPQIEAYQERLKDILRRFESAYGTAYADMQSVNVDLEGYPLPEPDITGDPDGLLYDSKRDYFGQLAVYKAHQHKERE